MQFYIYEILFLYEMRGLGYKWNQIKLKFL